jgi:UDP-N-acetylmuramate dehydrogenase
MRLLSLPERFQDFSVSNRPLAPLTTWGIGGVSRVFLAPRNEDDLIAVFTAFGEDDAPFHILGGGSNLLVGDGIIDEPVIHTAALNSVGVTVSGGGVLVECGAGVSLKRLFALALNEGWSGLEFLAGIPGTVGGAMAGNAGTKRGSAGESAARVRTIERGGATVDWEKDEIEWGYRASSLSRRDGVIAGAVFSLKQSKREFVLERAKSAATERKSQPYCVKTAGCVFKNPDGGNAGRLLDMAGCKGLSVGGAVVSRKHANFFENAAGASASDMINLARLCAKMVYDAFGVELELEIKTLGFREPVAPR